MGLKRFLRERKRLITRLIWLVPGLIILSIYNGFQVKSFTGDNLHPPPWQRCKDPSFFHRLGRLPTLRRCQQLENNLIIDPVPFQAGNLSLPLQSRRCPAYYSRVFEDLAPWKEKGIQEHDLETARKHSAFRAIVRDGRLYVELYYRCFQTRMMFTIVGIMQLLQRFPGQIPDVDIFFNCQDRPQITKSAFDEAPPPLFGYCSTKNHFDIPFPDWSFWGWPENKILPWRSQLKRITQQAEWKDRDSSVQWRGDPRTSQIRQRLIACNSTGDKTLLVHGQNWRDQSDLQNWKLESHCHSRYKLYAEGYAWSASYKYIMGCGSTVLAIDSDYYEFFTRDLKAGVHYVPISREGNLCQSISNARQWGESHPGEAQAIATRGQRFLVEDLSLDQVYGYMLHLIQEYGKLQKFKPPVPREAHVVHPGLVKCLAHPRDLETLERTAIEAIATKASGLCSSSVQTI
ncbi:protein O-glucosyltransferase 1 [Selaginella moellendorffii]|nr:protein O-glucosyltransferase 1 [Selaginella moellendorffii]|eukprot:XP_002982900.2 protein O-glucosyltransferase 1 [Selaginella moellendorffii]